MFSSDKTQNVIKHKIFVNKMVLKDNVQNGNIESYLKKFADRREKKRKSNHPSVVQTVCAISLSKSYIQSGLKSLNTAQKQTIC